MRILFIVPKMFTREELASLNNDIPEDFQAKSKEFWDYISVRLRKPRVIQRIYYDSLTKEGEEAIKFINESNANCGRLVGELVSEGATVYSSEDRLLVEETASWTSMLEKEEKEDPTIMDFLSQNMSDRNKFLGNVIDKTLKEDENGVLFVRPGRDMSGYLTSDIKSIKVQPFEPSDYLDSWLVTLKLKSKPKQN